MAVGQDHAPTKMKEHLSGQTGIVTEAVKLRLARKQFPDDSS